MTRVVTLVCALVTAIGSTPRPQSPSDLGGRWRVSLHEADGVGLDVRMTFESREVDGVIKWEAYSRAGAAREMIGGGTAALGRLLGRMPPHEALITISDGTAQIKSDTLLLTGMVDSPFLGRRTLTGTLVAGRLHATLMRAPSGALAGTIEARRDSTEVPLRDYRALALEAKRVIRDLIFDPELADRPEFARFFEELERRFGNARDDLDAVASFQALKPSLGISHIELIRNPRLARLSLDSVLAGDASVDPLKLVTLSFPAPGVAFLRIMKWDRVGPAVDRAFARIDSANVSTVILDIRGNPGGDATSMVAAAHLLADTTPVGVFLGRRWYASHRRPTTIEQLGNAPRLDSDASPSTFINDLRERGAVYGRVVPREPRFAGRVFLLIDNGSASASEPLAHVLKTSRRATLVGTRTAGAMLTALPHPLSDGWVVVVPEADFFAANGDRLEGRGVEPDVASAPNDVFLAVAEQLASSAPFSSAVLRGASLLALQRPDDAERAFRDALRQADAQNPAPSSSWRASVHKRIAAILAERGDRRGARHEYEEALRLIPGDVAAQAALRALP